MSFIEQIDLRALVIEAYVPRGVSIGLSEQNSNHCVLSSLNGVTDHSSAIPETQKYIYNQDSWDSNGPRIPKVHDCFDNGIITYRHGVHPDAIPSGCYTIASEDCRRH